MRGILGKKVGMTQLFDKSGAAIPVTIIEAGPCYVTQVKTVDSKDKYNAVQLGFEEVAERKLTKGERGHLTKAGAPTVRHLHEFRYEELPALNVGDVVKADVFAEGEMVDVTGVSKGRGFAGARQALRLCAAVPRRTVSRIAIAHLVRAWRRHDAGSHVPWHARSRSHG